MVDSSHRTVGIFTYMIHDGGDGCRVDRSVCLESLDVIQRSTVKELRGNAEETQ